MRLKDTYEEAKIEILSFECPDIITSSGDFDTGGDNGGAWTPMGW